MPQGDKPYFQFSKGINTEASLVSFPEGFSVDEENYDLFIDATRRKRKGLTTIAGSDQVAVTNNISGATGTFYWDSVNGDSNTHFIVKQKANFLNFYKNSSDTIAPNASLIGNINLIDLAVPSVSNTDIINSEIDISFGRGKAVVVGRYINPTLIEYTPATSDAAAQFTTSTINIIERDFKGVDDTLDMNQTTAVALTADQTYNLSNRGWLDADITAFKAAKGYYPSKNLIPALGYIGVDALGAASLTAQADWTKQFSPAALVAQLFQNVSAPQGHLTIYPFVNTPPLANSGPAFGVSTWTISDTSPGTQTITLTTTTNHGLVPGNFFYWTGVASFRRNVDPIYDAGGGLGRGSHFQYSFIGSYTVVTAPALNKITFVVTLSSTWAFWDGWYNQYVNLGTLTAQVYNTSNPTSTVERPQVTAFWAGRAFYMGIDIGNFSSKIYFSQILETDKQYGQCMQVADPTDARISDVVSSDGGVLYIPEMATPRRAVIVGSYLIVFATNGVWQVGPGQPGFFSPLSYSVRKIADAGICGKKAVKVVDQVPYYAGYNDVWRFIQDVQTGQLNVQNVSEHTIHTLYNAIPNKQYIKMMYDDLSKRLWMLYSNNASYTYAYDRVLLFDMRIAAITKYSFSMPNVYLTDVAAINFEIDQTKKILLDTFNSSTFKWSFNRLANTTWTDLGSPFTSYLLTSYDVVNTPISRKQAPYVHVFSKKTETGFDSTTGEYIPIAASSTKLQARWDWSDRSKAGKWGMPQETYRHKRVFVPDPSTPTTYDDGVPLVTTKNLVRGSGRTLQLYFYNNDSTKDSFLVGWNVRYSITGNPT